MKERLTKFMQTEGLTAAKLAEITNVQPSTVSHILAGRNNPRYDFLAAIARNFPKLNSRWLLLGDGNMYEKTDEAKEKSQVQGLPLIVAPETQQVQELPLMPMPAVQREQGLKSVEQNAPEAHGVEPLQVSEPTPTKMQQPVSSIIEQTSVAPNIDGDNQRALIQSNAHNINDLNSECKSKLRVAKIVIFNNDGTFEIYQN